MCGAVEATELIASLGTAFSRRVELQIQTPPTLRVVSDPPAATVMLDGTEIGVTPIDIPASMSLLVIEKRRTMRPGLRALLERTPAFARARALTRR